MSKQSIAKLIASLSTEEALQYAYNKMQKLQVYGADAIDRNLAMLAIQAVRERLL